MKYATRSEVQTQLSFIQKQIQNKQAPFKEFIADQQFQQKVSQYFPDYRDRIFHLLQHFLLFYVNEFSLFLNRVLVLWFNFEFFSKEML